MRTAFAPFGERHEELRARARRFVEEELAPRAPDYEREHRFPGETFRRLGELGFLGLKFPREHGGQGGDVVDQAVFIEELQRCGSGGLAAGLGTHTEIALPPIFRFGTAEQRRRYLEPGIRGELVGALAITEPGGGSDVAALRTRAEPVEGGWVLRGEKTFITNGVRADFLVTAVRSGAGGRAHEGISLLVVDRSEAVVSTPLEKLGWHASDTATVIFDEAFVPAANLLGPEGEGFKLVMANFEWERLVMSLVAIGAMAVGWERTTAWLRERGAIGAGAAGESQALRHRLVDLATQLHSCRCLTYDALARFARGERAGTEVAMTKLVTQRAACDFLDSCLQAHGLAGYTREHEIERLLRDARLGPIGGGADEIMREILAKRLEL